ncbi:MAG: UvrD-helicase domain-containing protein [Bacilli bacterium]|nr:UvrD-helicase domain-containing protein [Bacilli bacterium]
MAMKFNDEQLAAINSYQEKGNYLVSAGAGSGKTAVLTERIKRIVCDKTNPTKVSELLVLTFTNKAAAEMKTRTREALVSAFYGGELDQDLSPEVEFSDITTFDAFFLKLVKKYAYRLGLDPNIGIASNDFILSEKRKILEAILNEKYENPDPTFEALAKNYVLKNDNEITDVILGIMDKADLVPSKEEFYLDLKERFFSDEYFEARKKELYETLNDDVKAAYYLGMDSSNELLEKDTAIANSYLDLGDYETMLDRLKAEEDHKSTDKITFKGKEATAGFERNSPKYGLTESDNYKRAIIKELIGGVKETLYKVGDINKQKEKYLFTRPFVSLLVDIAKEVDARLSEYKKERGAYTFSDIASIARKLVNEEENSDILESIKHKYKFIMVDEYQDTSDLQEFFISKIANDNLFMVGDIKQSIYRFRNANPDIFAGKLRDFSLLKGGKAFSLQKNFRSRMEVISDINSIFERIMTPSLGDVDYPKGHALEFGNVWLYGDSPKPEYTTEILSYDADKSLSLHENEARVIANDIIDKVVKGFMVDVKGEVGPRKVSWKDFAILVPVKKAIPVYQKVFGEAKIPLIATIQEDLSDNDLNLLFMRLLKLPVIIGVDEKATKHCYASIKRSYLYEENDDKLFSSLIDGSYMNDPLILEMKKDKDFLLSSPIYKAVTFLIEKYKMVDKLVRIGDVKSNFKKIALFINNAFMADQMALDYEAYVGHFDDIKKYNIDYAMGGDSADGDAARIMSIHASKGLEFPIIYCPHNKRKLSKSSTAGLYLVSNKYGVLLPKNRTDERSDNFLYNLIKKEDAEKGLSEYMRLFYVELTRASDQIIFLLPKEEGSEYKSFAIPSLNRTILARKKTKEGKSDEYSLVNPNTFADFINLLGPDFLGKKLLRKDGSVEKPVPFVKGNDIEYMDEPHLYESIEVTPIIKEAKRASKSSLDPLDEGKLVYGDRMHRLLEVTSFITKDISFIKDEKDKAAVEKVLANSLFNDLSGFKEYHEYSYYDEVNEVHGSIDLLLVNKSKRQAIIIDYKSSHIDDEGYDKQMAIYKDYVHRVFGFDTKAYLLSISQGTTKEA